MAKHLHYIQAVLGRNNHTFLLLHFEYLIRHGSRILSNSFSIVASVFIAVGTCLPGQCPATVVSSDSTILAFRCPVIFNSEDIGRGVLYPVQVISNTQYVVRGSRQLAIFKPRIWYSFLSLWHQTDNNGFVQISLLHIQNDWTTKSMEQSPSLEACGH
jgi:hypothetical protein